MIMGFFGGGGTGAAMGKLRVWREAAAQRSCLQRCTGQIKKKLRDVMAKLRTCPRGALAEGFGARAGKRAG